MALYVRERHNFRLAFGGRQRSAGLACARVMCILVIILLSTSCNTEFNNKNGSFALIYSCH
jgi:hypothetical protein